MSKITKEFQNLLLVQLNNKQIKCKIKHFTIMEVFKMIVSGKLVLAPVQRGLVWNLIKKGDYIGVLLTDNGKIKSGYVPEIKLIFDGEKYFLVDGQQRISSIMHFIIHSTIAKSLLESRMNDVDNITFLNLDLKEKEFSLKFSEEDFVKEEYKQILKNVTFNQLPAVIQDNFLNFELPFRVEEVSSAELNDGIRKSYNILNNTESLNNQEKQKSLYDGTILYDAIFDLSKKILKVDINAKNDRLQFISFFIDYLNYLNGDYTSGSAKERNLTLKKFSNGVESEVMAKKLKTTIIDVVEVGRLIFPKGNVLGNINPIGKWQQSTIAAFLPWAVVINDITKTKRNPKGLYTSKQLEDSKEPLIESWRKLSNSTSWKLLTKSQSNNLENVNGRIKLLKKMFKDTIYIG